MKTRYAGLVPLVALLSACSARPEAAIESIYTSLNPASCKQTIDKDRPDEVPYLSCSGVAGHLWNVRRVESGRLSVVVVNAAQNSFPLNYQYVVTRSMSSLDDKAEWRVSTQNGGPSPIALIVAVQARENAEDPSKITTMPASVAVIRF